MLCVLILFQVDPTYKGRVGAMDAANFLKKSGISQVILSQVCSMFYILLK